MHAIVAWIVGLSLAANGMMMLAGPSQWYVAMPGVIDTGLFNAHFVREIGAAYFVAGTALVWLALSNKAWPAALAAAAFLALHAFVHLADLAAGREHAHQMLIDIPIIFVPPLAALWLVWRPGPRGANSRKGNKHDEMVSAALDQ
jgi:hypothetical protein